MKNATIELVHPKGFVVRIHTTKAGFFIEAKERLSAINAKAGVEPVSFEIGHVRKSETDGQLQTFSNEAAIYGIKNTY